MAENTENTTVEPSVGSAPEVKKKASQKEPERQDLTTLHERTIATLSYMGPLVIVPFYLKKDSDFCRFHGKQGLIVFIIFFFMIPLMVIDFVLDVVLIAQVVIFAYMGLAALSGRWKRLPFIYDYACKLEDTLSVKNKQEKEGEKMRVGETISDSQVDSNASEAQQE